MKRRGTMGLLSMATAAVPAMLVFMPNAAGAAGCPGQNSGGAAAGVQLSHEACGRDVE